MQSEDMDTQIYIVSNGIAFEKVDKDMVVARFFGCTGGQRRSVRVVERMAERLSRIDGV
jgi:RNase adaptor protein for sRNA GlmZ degradation